MPGSLPAGLPPWIHESFSRRRRPKRAHRGFCYASHMRRVFSEIGVLMICVACGGSDSSGLNGRVVGGGGVNAGGANSGGANQSDASSGGGTTAGSGGTVLGGSGGAGAGGDGGSIATGGAAGL